MTVLENRETTQMAEILPRIATMVAIPTHQTTQSEQIPIEGRNRKVAGIESIEMPMREVDEIRIAFHLHLSPPRHSTLNKQE